jgi:hypothetical protein
MNSALRAFCVETTKMPSRILQRQRLRAARMQGFCCCYCDLPMAGTGSPYHLALASLGSWFEATAEHLLARQDGGGDSADNIAAAHRVCNARRHRCAKPLLPAAFAVHVCGRIAKDRWFGSAELAMLRAVV